MSLPALELSPAGAAPRPRALPSAGGELSPLRFSAMRFLRVALVLMVVANLGYVPLVSYGRKEAPFLFNDLLVVAMLGIGILLAVRARRLLLDSTAVAALVFAAIGAFSAVLAIPRFDLSAFKFLFSIAYLLRWLAYFGFYLLVINFGRRSDVPALWRAIEVMILVFAGFGIVQSLFLPGFAQLVYPDSEVYIDWDYQGRRLVSSFLDPNFAGGLIVVGLLVQLSQVSLGCRVPRWKLLLLFAALVFTVSRSAVLGLMAGGLVILVARGLSRRLLRLGGLLLLLLLPFLPLAVRFAAEYGKFGVGPSALARVVVWLRALEIFMDHPVLGIGFNTYGFVQEAYGYRGGARAAFAVEGGLLFVAVMTGVVGLLVYTGMMGLVLARCRRIYRSLAHATEERALALGVAAVTVALVVHSLFVNSLLYPFLMEPLWVLWGMTFLMERRKARDGAAGRPVLVSLGGAGRHA